MLLAKIKRQVLPHQSACVQKERQVMKDTDFTGFVKLVAILFPAYFRP
jgi:hypothetical protein